MNDTGIQILGVSMWARGRGAGNEYHARGLIRTGMEGGVAKIYIEHKVNEKVEGTATLRLHKDEAIKLINDLKQIYNLETDTPARGLEPCR